MLSEEPQNKLPLISVVVPSLNQGQFLKETLESIFRQHYPRLELIVMDGGSTDESLAIIRNYERHITYWQSERDSGQTAAINAGMKRCNGDLVAWLNSDDFYCENSLWIVGEAYNRYPERGLYIGNGLRYNESEALYTPFCKSHLALDRQALIHGLDYILQPSCFFLRSAWIDVGGLMQKLNYCMDWDICIRIAERYSVVLINEFLAVSREYSNTKTRRGKLNRVCEIFQMTRKHSGQEMTLGGLAYLLETLGDLTTSLSLPPKESNQQCRQEIKAGIQISQEAISREFAKQVGNSDGFPEHTDPQDSIYLPFVRSGDHERLKLSENVNLPSISVITPSLNQAKFLEKALLSIFNQNYPKIESIVIDGGSEDGTVDILKRYDSKLAHWVSEPDKGPANAINKGFKAAKGDIIAWLNSDDMYANNALWEAGRAFADNPELEVIFGNALYIDQNDALFMADHGTYRTSFYYGKVQPRENIPAYWKYVHAVPQPTVFFRRALLNSCGKLDETYHFIFDFEFFFRFSGAANIQKIERTMAFYRIHSKSKSSEWSKFEVELYRFSRSWWPSSVFHPMFWSVSRDFLSSYMQRNFSGLQRGVWFWVIKSIAGLSVLTRLGNPEQFKKVFWRFLKPKRQIAASASTLLNGLTGKRSSLLNTLSSSASQQDQFCIKRNKIRHGSVFCSYIWPRHPGHSGGEIRDFNILKHLLKISDVDFFSLYEICPDERHDWLAKYVDFLHSPNSVQPEMMNERSLRLSLSSRILRYLRNKNYPVLGPRYHNDTSTRFPVIGAYSLKALDHRMKQNPPDFLFVSPQSNPLAMMLDLRDIHTRLIMASYDVESIRIKRFASSTGWVTRGALSLEARRANRFERDNLRFYDGIIAVSELDKDIFVNEYNFHQERVLVLDNGVDPDYFAFTARQPIKRPEIVYTGALAYLPNQQAAWRLIRGIMPIVWEKFPNARLWIVGQQPGAKLASQSDGERIVVTGRVEDVRPYLAGASAGCVPLSAGSGTKYKVLEAMSAGMPLVCTPLAAEGLELEDGKHLLLGDEDKNLASGLMRLLQDPVLVKKIAQQGREWVKARYAWDVILPRMDPWLDSLKSMPKQAQ